MAKERSVRAKGGSEGPARTTVDWHYALYYLFFFVCLMLIAYFGVIAEV